MSTRDKTQFYRRGIEEIASDGDRLSRDARVHHARSLGSERIALPALWFGAAFLERWITREEPQPNSWRDSGYNCVAPAIFIVRDAIVHGSAGLVTIGSDIVEETLVGVNLSTIEDLTLQSRISLSSSRTTSLQETHITFLAGGQTNYFHAIMDGVARAASVPHDLLERASSVLLPDQGLVQQRLFPLLKLPPHLEIRKVEDGEALQVENLVLPMSVYGTSNYHPIVRDFFSRLSFNIPAHEIRSLPKRIYIDRRNASGRRLINETEVVAKLKQWDFVPISLEMLSLSDQVQLFRGAEAIVAPHGAGLTNIGFSCPGCIILELHMDAYVHWGFRHLAALCKLRYDCVVGRVLGEWSDRLPAAHALSWVISADHVGAAVAAQLGLGPINRLPDTSDI